MDKGFLDSSTTPCGVTVNFPWRLAAAKAAAVKSVGASHFENDSTTATPPSVSASRQRSTTPAGELQALNPMNYVLSYRLWNLVTFNSPTRSNFGQRANCTLSLLCGPVC
jgi:hypothetical protein